MLSAGDAMPKKKQPEPDLSYIEPDLRHLAVPIEQLKPNPRQVNTHNERSIAAIARSLKRHGQKKNAVANRKGEMVAGWGTVLAAAERNGWTHLAVVFSDEDDQGLDEYALEDNRTAQLSEFDEEALAKELERLSDIGSEIDDLGWNDDEIKELLKSTENPPNNEDDQYTKKITAPIYKPTGDKPLVKDLFDKEKSDALVREIEKSDIPDDEKAFLIEAAKRHTVFNYHRIADYYAHSGPKVQRLMEDSALVIIDFGRAIELGYVKLSEEIAAQYLEDYPDDN